MGHAVDSGFEQLIHSGENDNLRSDFGTVSRSGGEDEEGLGPKLST